MTNQNLFPDHDHEDEEFTEADLLKFLGVTGSDKEPITSKNDEFYVYLAGPIEKDVHANIKNPHSIVWRESVLSEFDTHNLVWDVLDPTRGKRIKDELGNWIYSDQPLDSFHYNPFFIFSRDLEDIDKADIVVVNLIDAVALSIGTCFEFGYAYANEKFVITVCPDKEIAKHPFVSQASDIILDKEEQIVEACVYARSFLSNYHATSRKEPRIYRIDKGFA